MPCSGQDNQDKGMSLAAREAHTGAKRSCCQLLTLITGRELLVDLGSLLTVGFSIPTLNPVSIGMLATPFLVVDLDGFCKFGE